MQSEKDLAVGRVDVADADLPAETHTTSSSSSESTFKAATISGNNLGLSLQLLKQFGNVAVIGA